MTTVVTRHGPVDRDQRTADGFRMDTAYDTWFDQPWGRYASRIELSGRRR